MGQGLSGKLGGVVYRRSRGDTIVCAAPVRKNPDTPAQAAVRRRLERAVSLWAELPLDAIARWRAYADSPSYPLPSLPQGGGRRASGYAVFRGLAAKYLQVHGGFDAPTEPPSAPFLGDGILVSLGPLQDEPLGEGVVRFTATGPNSDGVLTELLLQQLPARHRLPKARDYRTQRFVGFASGSLAVPVRVEPGAYACAIRFVRASTGQATALVPLGTVEVG